ncbi:hypothetical protein Baya_15783 [Bagarius yarrelli]|uniref:Uncharacterized protein n=1 Tax=Bagarius yarrelli TaxID=175774 RepID=A0A556VGT0_BAGYA|nr:hypothetical protein Baya_15783 [Bagarius yarrelli]
MLQKERWRECGVFILHLMDAGLGNEDMMILQHEAQSGGGTPAISWSGDDYVLLPVATVTAVSGENWVTWQELMDARLRHDNRGQDSGERRCSGPMRL